jgi:Uma2 family endonuclease
MSTAKRLHYSYDEYRRLLERSDIKLEFCDGVIYAMAGGTLAHARLAATAIALLKQALGRCAVFSSDAMVRIEASDLSTYPAASVVCGEVKASTVDANALSNPTLLVEVTSRSTEDYDRGDKLSHYKQLPSLRAVLIVSHRTKAITVIEREGTKWSERELRSGEQVTLRDPELRFPVDELYADVELEAK